MLNISGSLCNSPKDMGAQGRWPLGQSHLGGAVIYWRCVRILFFFFVFCFFLRYYQLVTNQLKYDSDPDNRQISWQKADGTKLPAGSTCRAEG